MKIVIDADGCPVVNATVNIARQFNIECVIVCDTSHEFSLEFAKTVIVSKGNDSADFEIVELIGKDDIVVTQDYGLAAMCLSKNASAINQNGLIYTPENIDNLLLSRHISKVVRRQGKHLKGPKKRTGEQDRLFESTLREMIKKALAL